MNFFIIGGQRCGTTLLYELLSQHPEIAMAEPVRPEPKYFIENSKFDEVEYKKLFNYEGKKIFGEKSTSYIESVSSLTKINAAFPDSKILILLREPTNRAISNYYFSVKNNLETRDVEEALMNSYDLPYTTSVNPFEYINRSRYIKFIDQVLSIFNIDRVKILIFEELISDEKIIRDVYSFLEVKSNFSPDFPKQKVNKSTDYVVEQSLRNKVNAFLEKDNKRLYAFLERNPWDV